jgi:2-succinyl-5-enolpyruvyl-6-hydroxy-3-cyclohexene-1-carboxylate synthase
MSVPTPPDPGSGAVQATFAATLVDEWVRAGVTDAVVCPGSRSTPLALALADRSELRLHVRLDERGAGFFAVGLAIDSGRPAIVCTTSGTAAAELHPAVVEAHHARVPMLVCTADRPPELHGVGAPQTIDQRRLYGPAVRWSTEPGPARTEDEGTWRPLAARSYAEAVGSPLGPGPVHLNLAFREPLVAGPGPLPPGRPGGRPWLAPPGTAGPAVGGDGAGVIPAMAGRRGIVIAGARCGPPAAVAALADRLGWPLLADPRSGCRVVGPAVVGAAVVGAADAVLRVPEARRALIPEVVVAVGEPWASRVVAGFLAESSDGGAEVVAVDPWWRWIDPDRIVSRVVRAHPGAWLLAAVAWIEREAAAPVDGTWADTWRACERAAQEAIDQVLADRPASDGGALTEPALARRILGSVPDGTRVVVASSMPVRDLEWFAPPLDRAVPVFANRGANGIDGVVATAQGMSCDGGGPVVGLLGDLAFLHDVSSLVRLAGAAPSDGCTLVVVDNGGGGIFQFLPQAGAVETGRFETLFGTPAVADVVAVARGFGIEALDVTTASELDDALSSVVGRRELAVVRVRVPDRVENVDIHTRINDAVAEAVRSVLG